MLMLKSWSGAACLALALAGGAGAETDAGKSRDPSAGMTGNLAALFGQEKTGMSGVTPDRIQAIVAPAEKVAAVPAAAKADKEGADKQGSDKRGAGKRGAAKAAAAPTYDAAWLAAYPAARADAQFRCLATALYFEARGESIRGQAAVAEVILNRADLPSYPNTICGVVNQTGSGGCAFSYVCDGRPDAVTDRAAWDRALRVASAMLAGAPRLLTEGATHFHTPAVRPTWSRQFAHTATIGAHIFYRQPLRTAMN